jgi:geranylgeranyl pyrophosphate synthase
MLAETTEHFKIYVDKVRQEIIRARHKAFESPAMLPHSSIFKEMMEYNEEATGKLLRPTLCVMMCDALGGQHAWGIHMGAAIELIHSGSLIHDDIIDDDLFRRGMKTAHEAFSVKAAILFGDHLYVTGACSVRTLPPTYMAESFKEVMDAIDRVSSGAMREGHRNPFDKDEYIETIKLKTAALYRACGRLGAITADATTDTMRIVSDYSEKVGIAFQITDDLVDIYKSLNEDVPLGDVKEGKSSLPIILAYQQDPELRKYCDEYVNGVEDMRKIKPLTAALNEYLLQSEVYVRQLIEDANDLIEHIPVMNGYDKILREYGPYIVKSMRAEK